ncbi:DUF2637 domain-containing protein [Streptomyces sp. DT20]|uniref:DUF2637 domain-containing protein n=1 Tax=Streptomyces sp. DT20 TaxID=3416519 RepID=UPI003CF0302F
MTITMEPAAVSAAASDRAMSKGSDSVTGAADSAAPVTDSAAPEPSSAAALPAPDDVTEERPAKRHRGLMIPIAFVAFASGLAAAAIGFALSYGALRRAAVNWGFRPGWQSDVFPIGVDGLIIALYTIDLVLAWKRMSRPWLRLAAHGLTAVTIVLNMAAAAGSAPGAPGLTDALREHPARLLAHAGMPIAYVLLTEAARWAIVRTAQLEAGGYDEDRLTLADWALRLPTTWKIFKHAKTWPTTYAEARTHVRELVVYRIWLKHREEIEAGLAEDRVGVLDRMPDLLAPYGVSVDEARALPALMQERERQLKEIQERAEADRADRKERERREEQRRRELQARQDDRERQQQAREDEHAERVAALAAEAEETRLAGELAVLRAETGGAAKAAQAAAEGAGAAAELQAQTTLAAARRVATEEERRLLQEETAEESARTAEANRAAAEATRAAAEIARRTAEETARTAQAEAVTARATADRAAAQARTEEAAQEAAARNQAAAEANRAAAEADWAAAETARATAKIRAAAAHAEALSNLDVVQIKTRVVARVLLSTPQADGATLAAALGGASPSTASTYKKSALELIAQGYPEHDPALDQAVSV